MRKRPALGLHTPGERAKALDLALRIYRQAKAPVMRGDSDAFHFASGYLQAFVELAESEGERDLAERARDLKDALLRTFETRQ